MNKLVIHPNDPSTTFLSKVYENLSDVTLVRGGVEKNELMTMVDSHDQVIMLGHGTPHGLMSVGQFPGRGFVIDDSFAPTLAKKNNSIFVWCNADQYVDWNMLRGFYTGMFVSEVSEAYMMGLRGVGQSDVDESNYAFVDILNQVAHEHPETMHASMKDRYGVLAHCNPVAQYNHDRLYVH